MRPALLLVLALLLPLALPPAVTGSAPPAAAEGFAASLLAPLPAPTALAFGPGNGDGPDLYATTLAGDVLRLSLRWTPAGPVAEDVSVHQTGFSQPLGLAFDGGVLYVADSHDGPESERTDGRVTRVDVDGTRTVVVDGLPNGRHNTNHLRFGPDGRLYITNGNPNDHGEASPPDVFPYSGAILSVDVDEVTASPAVLRYVDENGATIPPSQVAAHPRNADFAAKVDVYGSGFRNVYGVAFDAEGRGYTAMNGADDPSSQDALYRVTPGADHGFPFCFNEGEPGAVGANVSVVPNPVFPTHDCSGVPPATALLGWHVCATGLDVAPPGSPFGRAVYVAECGPFFPEPHEKGFSTHDTGHKVARVLLDEDGNAVRVEDFLTGLALPTDALFGPDGALYVADAEAVLRVAPLPDAAPGAAVPVLAAGFSFVAPVVVVPLGTPVEFVGAALPHTVTTADTMEDALAGRANDADNGDGSPDTFHADLPMGARRTHVFQEPGVHPYFCALHAGLGMVGAVVVVDPTALP